MQIKRINPWLEFGVYGSFNKFWQYLVVYLNSAVHTALGGISKKYADTFK